MPCQSGVWSAEACPGWSGDLNWLIPNAGSKICINGVGLGNAPTGDWYFIEVIRHVNSGNYYLTQRATAMTGPVGSVWVRGQQSGSAGSGWSSWVKHVRSDGDSMTGTLYLPDVYLNNAGRWASTSIPGYEIPSAVNCSGGHFETHVYCSGGKKILGGGCYDSSATERALVRNNPIGDSGWQCRSRDVSVGQYTCLYAYAICATR